MANPKIKWNLHAFKDIRKSDEVKDVLQDVVDDVIAEVGRYDENGNDFYKGEVSEGKNRAAGRVWTAGTHAERSNALHNTLIKALVNIEGDVQ